MQIIDGKFISNQIKDEIKKEIERNNLKIGLTVIQVGDNPASNVYVRNKMKACEYVGITSNIIKLDEKISQNELLNIINKCNEDENINGILVQLPLPKHIDTKKVIDTINPKKDVDGFTKINCGSLFVNDKSFISCTPLGVLELLKRYNIEISGKNCVIVGRSNEVGKPMALLMLNENATVTIAHSRTKNLQEITSKADILIVAIGKSKMITKDFVKNNAVVIDIGINRDENNKLCGDVDFDDVKDKASFITPVPGGVGPMTIAMLLKNCVNSVYNK